MYRNIVFDLGGVVVDFNPEDYLLGMLCNPAAERDVMEIVFNSPEWQHLDAGLITQAEAERTMLKYAEKAGRTFEVQAVLDDWMVLLHPRHRTLDLIRHLKARGFQVYFLSNISHQAFQHLKSEGILSVFDGGIASCEVKINKPDHRIYEALVERYHLNVNETIFIDDNKENSRAAYQLGMTGIHYRGHSQLIKALASCGIKARGHGRIDQPASPAPKA